MKKRKIEIILVLVGILLLSVLSGCGKGEEKEADSELDVEVEDSNFIKDIGRSVTERGIIVAKEEKRAKESGEELDQDEFLQHYRDLVKSESDIVYKYKDSEFMDQKLKKLGMDYINGLQSQEKALEYILGDEDKFYALWSKGYDERSVTLLELVNQYGVEVDENTLVTLRQNAQSVKEENEIKKEINEMMKTIDFKLEDGGDTWKEYSTIIENTTNINFDHFNLNIKLLDKDEVVIRTTSDSTTNWISGEKVKFKFSTDENFNEIKWDWEYYN